MRDNGEIQGRYELVDGEIISKMGQKPLHAYIVKRLTELLTRLFGASFIQIQLPIQVNIEDSLINEPEPDAAVVAKPAEAYLQSNPGPPDVLIVF
jgi:Uma2 family endonuclease